MNPELLNEVFRFKHKRPSASQEAATCARLVQHFCEFVSEMEPEAVEEEEGFASSLFDPLVNDKKVPLHQFAAQEHEELKRVAGFLPSSDGEQQQEPARGDVWIEQWLPKYGCALQMEMTSASSITLRVVFPDAWTHVVHFLPGSECVHSAVPNSSGVLNCGTIHPSMKTEFMTRLTQKLAKVQKKTGVDRSAARKAIGHQKTPQFIATLARLAKARMGGPCLRSGRCEEYKVAVRGGTTDVGLHTGGSYRDTCWSLVQATIRQNLPGYGAVFEKTIMNFQFSLLVAKTSELETLSRKTSLLDKPGGAQFYACAEDVFAMLQHIGLQVVELVQRSYIADGIEAQCAQIRGAITGSIDRVSGFTATQCSLPDKAELSELWQSMTYPQMPLVVYTDNFKHSMGEHDVAARALEQIRSVDVVDPCNCSPGGFVAWLSSIGGQHGDKSVVLTALRAIESFLISQAPTLQQHAILEGSVDGLRFILSEYEGYARQWDREPLKDSLFDVEQRSRELLVKWLGFCLVHRNLSQSCELLKSYGIALQWQDLSVAVLREQAAIDALGRVAAYIRTWNQSDNPPLFHLSNQSPTLRFARSFARSSDSLQGLLAAERQYLNQHVAMQWNIILQKKQTARDLRVEIQSMEATIAQNERLLRKAQAKLAEENRGRSSWERLGETREMRQYRHIAHQLRPQVAKKERMLATVLQCPFTVSALPEDKTLALEVVFFLNMPADIALLGQLCVAAQRALAPLGTWTSAMPVEHMQETTWLKHVRSHGLSPNSSGTVFTACPLGISVPHSYGPPMIDSLSDEEDYAIRCVWYPPGGNNGFFWKDASGYSVNPFKISRATTVSYFTHTLPCELQSLQWAIASPGGDGGSDEKRGNLAYSKLREWYPDDFDRDSFIALGQLRAFPNQQIRKLCCALKDNSLPWHHASVKAVAKQALYQMGELADLSLPVPLWKTDIASEEGLAILCEALDRAASSLERTPRKFEDVPLLSELAAFVSQRAAQARDVVAKFVTMCQRWANDERAKYRSYHSAVSSQLLSDLRSKECLLYGYALQGFSLGELRDAKLFELAKLVLLFRNSMLYTAESNLRGELECLDVVVTEIMTRRIASLVQFVQGHHPNQTLTKLLQVVNDSAPNDLAWEAVKPKHHDHLSTSFIAYNEASDTHFAINLFSGSVLMDGSTPGGLPAQIRANTCFRENFGDQDFEVSYSKGVYRTAHSIRGCFLEFSLPAAAGGELFIREVYLDAQKAVVKLLELCSRAWLKQFTAVLPARVVKLHSLWHWVEENCVLARPKAAKLERDVAFIVTFGRESTSDGGVPAKCYQVRMAYRKNASPLAIQASRATCDSFVTINGNLTSVLAKFEDSAFIHVLRGSSGCLKISLPRFRLNFVLDVSLGLRSVEYEGYVLDETQQLSDAFPNFRRYLVLRLSDTRALAKPRLKILTPVGQVIKKDSSGGFDTHVSTDPAADLSVAVFDVHRRLGTLVTESTVSRLQLCALLAATGLNIPSDFLKMTGAEAALKAMRGCYVSHPFSAVEKQSLADICAFGYREPALKVLANSLLRKSARCSFLQADGDTNSRYEEELPPEIDCADELDAYCAMRVELPARNVLRVRLDAVEEKLVLGSVLERESHVKRVSTELMDIDTPPVSQTFVEDVEKWLSRLLAPSSAAQAASVPSLPIRQLVNDVMGREMNAELYESWRAYHEHPDTSLTTPPEALLDSFEALLQDVRSKRSAQEQFLFESLAKVSDSNPCSHMLAMINYSPRPTVGDIVRSSFDTDVLAQLAPQLSQQGRAVFKAAVLQFMELCVLEDKLERLVVAAQQGAPETYFVDELSSTREWSSEEHPYWLAFEIEGRLQIRHEQYVVARHLIESPGSVCQMNMGRGKTRVILPMLFLYYSHRYRGEKMVRAHFLTPLLSETRQFMHRYLSASTILGLQFVEQPFHRSIDLDANRLGLLLEVIDEAKAGGKFLMLAPEHRMSLELKRLDLVAAAEASDTALVVALDEILDGEQYIDILDESDAVLHHKYHLVYAVGVPQKLLAGEDRWFAVEALFRILHGEISGKSRATEILMRPHVSFQCCEYADRLGGYSGLRLNASVENKEAVRTEFKRALALDLMDDPSFSLRWLRAFSTQGELIQNQLVQAITDPTVSLDAAIAGLDTGVSRFRDRLLALRGLIAFGILEHCLEKRHRVEYGLPDPGTRPKRMAIPFRAADIPSERSEFSHPEVGITLTILAYYHEGLSEQELKEALQQLLKLGVSEQSQYYTRWYAAVKNELAPVARDHLPTDAHQLSPKDSRQFALLYETFRFTTEVLNFFLNTCVFPSDTTQYPHRLSRSAWNLAGGDWNIGFSGTNDNHRLLPLSVKQNEPDQPSLLGTNGRMIDCIMQVSQGYDVIWTNQLANKTPWKALLLLAMEKQAHALIDTGALLAGVLNNDAATFLLEQPGFAFAGVTYYDTRTHLDCWAVLDATSKHVTPLKKATVLEKDTFVIFDDARSRGSDMKLYPNAVAVLTLGPKLAKDKMMQGAGRMRQLGCDQTLRLVSLDEVAQSILQVCGKPKVSDVDMVDILDWVMENTKSEVVHGLIEWASSGLHFSKTRQDPEAELTEENWSLEALYSHAYRPKLISDIVRSKVQTLYGVEDPEATPDALTASIYEHSCTYGLDDEVLVATHNEECERELHIEHFEERVREKEEKHFTPASEDVWDYTRLLAATSVLDLNGAVEVQRLGEYVAQCIVPCALSQMRWDIARVFGTKNFFSSVLASQFEALNEFTRVVDVMLLFRDGSVLLLSEYEADKVLQLLWASERQRSQMREIGLHLVNLSFAVEALEKHGADAMVSHVPWALGNSKNASEAQLSGVLVASCLLLNGETMFTKYRHEAVKTALRQLLQPLRHNREVVLQEFVASREHMLKWPRSLLHELCHEMDLADLATQSHQVGNRNNRFPGFM